MFPVHPVTETNRLLRDSVGKGKDPLLASLYEFGDAKFLDISFAFQPELFLDFDLDPEPLAIESVLIALSLAEHGVVALEEILVRAAPGVMDTHRIVRGDRTIEKRVTIG